MACCAGIGGWGLIDPASMTGTMLGASNDMLTGVSSAGLFICSSFLILSIISVHMAVFGAAPTTKRRINRRFGKCP